MSDQKTDFQIAWELSQTKDKPFFVDTIKKLLNAYDGEEISFSKFVEELNIAAYKWQQSHRDCEELKKENDELRKEIEGLKISLDSTWNLYEEQSKRISELEEGLREGFDIDFIVWYSGMDEHKVRAAFERYKKEIEQGQP